MHGIDSDCGYVRHAPTVKQAGDMVDIDLTKPIDLSQMMVNSITSQPVMEYNSMEIERKCELFCHVINDYGDREELTIEFTLKSKRMPKNNPFKSTENQPVTES